MISGFNQQIKGLVVNEFDAKLMYLDPPWYLYRMLNGTNSAETVLACREIFPTPAHIGSWYCMHGIPD